VSPLQGALYRACQGPGGITIKLTLSISHEDEEAEFTKDHRTCRTQGYVTHSYSHLFYTYPPLLPFKSCMKYLVRLALVTRYAACPCQVPSFLSKAKMTWHAGHGELITKSRIVVW
jgi:hypothetical protein